MKDVASAQPFIPTNTQKDTFEVNAVGSARKSNAGRESIGSVQSSSQMEKIQLSINKDDAGSTSYKSQKSFRVTDQVISIDNS